MSINFHSLQYNECNEDLYEGNINSKNFDIEFNKTFCFKQEKNENELFDLNKLYFIENRPRDNISQIVDEIRKNENETSIQKEENSRKNERSKKIQIKLIVENGKPSEEKVEKVRTIKKKHKNYSTRECSEASEKSENQDKQIDREEKFIFLKSDKKIELNGAANKYDNFLMENTINNKGINNIDKGKEMNMNKNKVNNNNGNMNNNINTFNKINNIDNNSNNMTNILSNTIINGNNPKKYNNILNKKTKREKDSTSDKTNDSNYITKTRIISLDTIIDFINEKIKIKYNGNIGKSINKKEILKIDKNKLYHSTADFDKNFLDKTLKEILSDEISGKYSNYRQNHNKCLIQNLINEDNPGTYFKKLFEFTFLNYLEHIRGTKFFEELDGLINVDEILNDEKFKIDKDEIDIYKKFISKYEEIIKGKKSRKSRKQKNSG